MKRTIFQKSLISFFIVLIGFSFIFIPAKTSARVPYFYTGVGEREIINKLITKGTNKFLEGIGSALEWAVMRVLKAVVHLTVGISTWAVSDILVLSNFSSTNPANNPVLKIGWTLIRDIVNILFILGLAIIGILTALDKNKFGAQKSFSLLIIIALIINFTPAICGLFVDVANAATRFFTSQIKWERFETAFDLAAEEIDWKDMASAGGGAKMIKNIISIILLGGFTVFLVKVLLQFAYLFVVRHIAITLLTIISPLALFAYIFDQTRKYFTQWWNEFFKYVIKVVGYAFLIYLAQAMIEQVNMTEYPEEGGDVLPILFLYGMALGLMAFGAVYMSKGVATLAKATGMATKGLKTGAAKAGKFTTKRGKKAASGATGAIGGAVAGFREGFQETGSKKEGLKGAFRGVVTRAGREKGRQAIAETGSKMLGVSSSKYYTRRTKKWAPDQDMRGAVNSMESQTIKEKLKGPAATTRAKKERIALAETLTKRGEFDLGDQKRERKIIREVQGLGGDLSSLSSKRPDLSPFVKGKEYGRRVKEEKQNLMDSGTPEHNAGVKARRAVKDKMIGEEVEKMSGRSLLDLPPSILKLNSIAKRLNKNKLKIFGTMGAKAQKEAIKQSPIWRDYEKRIGDETITKEEEEAIREKMNALLGGPPVSQKTTGASGRTTKKGGQSSSRGAQKHGKTKTGGNSSSGSSGGRKKAA